MKLIEAMKLKKELQVKAEDLRQKIGQYCAHLSIESPVYGNNQSEMVRGWIQGHQDIIKQIRKVAIAIQKTNLATRVTLSVGGDDIELSIAEWILRRRELAGMEAAAWGALSDGKLKPGQIMASDGKTPQSVTVVRYYDPVMRDRMVDAFKHEPSHIDAKLEVVNAVTDLIE